LRKIAQGNTVNKSGLSKSPISAAEGTANDWRRQSRSLGLEEKVSGGLSGCITSTLMLIPREVGSLVSMATQRCRESKKPRIQEAENAER
jgi:hypothetical protein